MAERDADRAHPERLCDQAVKVFTSQAKREISHTFCQQFTAYAAAPELFGPVTLIASAQTPLETAIAWNIADGCNDVTVAIGDALRSLGEGYAREQICQLIADQHPHASIISECFKIACNEAASVAAAVILSGEPPPRTSSRLQLDENLLPPPTISGSP